MDRDWGVCAKCDAGCSWLDETRRANGGEKSSTVAILALFGVTSSLPSTDSRPEMSRCCEDGVVSYFRFGGGIGSS